MQFLVPLGICIHSARVPIPYVHPDSIQGYYRRGFSMLMKFTYNQIHDYSRIWFVEPKLSKRVFMVLVKK